jgi:hypothetical protein
MATPTNGITPEVIRAFMPPYHLSPDLLAATIATLPAPPPGSTAAWRQARLTRLFQEIADLHPADAAQARLAAQLLSTRELIDAYKARAHTPDLDINQMCRLGRTADALLRSAATLERTLAHHQKMPAAFFGVVIQDEVDVPALEAIWASQIPASARTGSLASVATGSPASPRVGPATTPPPAPPQPATALASVDPSPDPQPDPEPTPSTSPQPQAQPSQSPNPTTPPGVPPAPPRTRPAGPNWMIEHLDQGPGYTREVLRRRTPADSLPEPAE